jgi:plastocyanin
VRVRTLTSIILLCALAAVAACGGATPGPTRKRVDPETAGVISGHAGFKGTAPRVETIRMRADPYCEQAAAGHNTTETVLIAPDGSLANVFVYVNEALADYTFDVPVTPVVLDQKGCRYHPHVFGVRVGQPVELLNSDDTFHNAHARPANNPEFDKGEPVQGMRVRQTFVKPEIMVPIKCNVHGWMHAYAGVMTHPFFAVSGADGSFSLNGLPPGTYTIEAWHELYGTRSQQVTVGSKQTETVAFTFTPK